MQNANSLVFNNAATTITADRAGTPFPAGPNIIHNFLGDNLDLRDPGNLDFRPKQTSPLVDAGSAVPGVAAGYSGRATDIGAYEFGGENWKPGYRNRIHVAREGKRIKVWLSMPAPEPVTVSVTAQGAGAKASPARVTFTPRDWMNPQTVSVVGGPGGAVRLEAAALDAVTVPVRE